MRASQFKKSWTTVSTTERYFTACVVCLIVECSRRQRKGNEKKIKIIIGRLGGKWIERYVPQLLIFKRKEVELLFIMIMAKPGDRIHLALEKLKMTFSSRPPHHRTILKDLENKCIVATKQCRGIHKDMLHQPQNTNSMRDKRDNTAHMVFEGEHAVEFHVQSIQVGTSANGNPRQDQVTMGRVHCPTFTNRKSLNFVRIPVIAQLLNPSQVPVKGGSNSRYVCLLGNNCQWRGVISIGMACTPPAQTFHWYKG